MEPTIQIKALLGPVTAAVLQSQLQQSEGNKSKLEFGVPGITET